MMKKKLSKKLVFITGGSEGIGKALASDCLKAGANVIILSRNPAKLENCIKELTPLKTDPSQIFVSRSCDVTDFNSTEETLQSLMNQFGVPDILMNVAGFAKPDFFDTQDLADIKDMIDLNYLGSAYTCKIVVSKMIERKSGFILNTSSMCGFLGLFGYAGYCASKFAVVGFSEALMRELKPFNIHVAVLCPPNTRTPGLLAENKNKPKEVLATEEKAKVVNPEDISGYTLHSLMKRKFMIIPTLDGRLAYYLNRISPKIMNLFISR